MGVDKGSLSYAPSGEDQRSRCARLLSGHCEEVFISCRAGQVDGLAAGLRGLVDLASLGEIGPAAGLLTAHRARADAAWLVLAVDFPLLDEEGLSALVSARKTTACATCFLHGDGTPEPLLTIWEPAGLAALADAPAEGARRALERGPSVHLRPRDARWLLNVNSPGDLTAADFPVRPSGRNA